MTTGVNVEMAFVLLLAGAGAVVLMRSWKLAGWVATCFVAAATALAWIAGLSVLLGGGTEHGFIAGLPRFGSALAVSLDSLGAFFLLLITGVSFLATLYSVGYMGIYRHESPGRFYSLLQLFIAGMMGVVCVSDWLFFIVLWELMTLASYFLVTFEREDPAAVRAGFKYFIMTHVATAGLLITAVVLWRATGSFSFEAHRSGLAAMGPALRNLLFGLYLLAFATKAGIFPFGDWLPDAHPAAPSGVSAILSGVMIKLGAYGVLRVFWSMQSDRLGSDLMTWGVVIAAFGTLSAFVGGITAMKENDCKRLLAFSSISQTGYIFLALGIGIAFATRTDLAALSLLALIAAGFHILNDAVYKSLLFMSAGSILYSTGTRDLNKVGGLSVVMPTVAAAALVGVLSLAGLPPTNGFSSKWMIYQSAVSGGLSFAPFIAAAVVAFFVSLSTLAYALKFYNSAFLGNPAAGYEPQPIPGTMSFTQAVLGLVCVVVGLSPFWAVRLLATTFGAGTGASPFSVGRLGGLTPAGSGLLPANWSPIVLVVGLIVCFIIAELIRRSGHASTRAVPSWYCGEEHPSDEVRYRAGGLYSPFNEVFAKVYPKLPLPRLPALKRLRPLLDLDNWLYNPMVRGGGKAVDKVSRSHVGIPQLYMIWQVGGVIIVVALLFLLVR